MKLICTQDNFKKAIYQVERIVAKKNTLPILNNILFKAEKGYLTLLATNLEIGISVKMGAKIEKEGSITLPAQLISNFANNLPAGENITLEAKENKLKISGGQNKAIIKGMPADDFPLIPNKKNNNLLELSSSEFKEALLKVMPAISFNEVRQELTGINILFQEKNIFLAATDSFRLAECEIKLEDKNKNKEEYENFKAKKNSVIIPAKTLLELIRIIPSNQEENIRIAIEESQIFFEINNTKIVSRLINGKYPEYKNIIPQDYKTKIIGKQNLIQSIIKMASIFSKKGNNEITLKINSEKKKIFILSESPEVGENSSELNFSSTGPNQEVLFNAKYLLDGINTISTSQVVILLNSASTPVAIKAVDEKTSEILNNFIYIVMPIKN